MAKLVAAIALGSGLINIISVIGPSLPERMEILGNFFSLEFTHLTRFFVMLTGFALVFTSINIFKRKQRAFYLAIVLSVLSILFHMTKGLD